MNNGENLTNVGEIVGIVLTVLAIFIIVLSILVGIKRGMKKSLFRLGWLFVTALILWFVTPPISNLLNTIDLTSLNLDIMGPVHRLSDIGVNILNQVVQGVGDAELANILSSSTALNSFAENLPTLLINIILFVILFFVTKYLLWPIYALISSKIFDKDKRARKQYEKRLKELKKKGMPITNADLKNAPQKKNNYRLVGGIFGAVTGLLVCAVAFSPIVGVSSIYNTVYSEVMTTTETGEEVPFLSTIEGGEEVNSILSSYESSASSKILRYTGMEFMSNVIFSNMAVMEVNNEKIKLTDEVDAVVSAFNQANAIAKVTDKEQQDVTKQDVTDVITSVKEIFFDIENSNLIYIIGDEILPQIIDLYVINNENFVLEFNGVDYAQLIKDAYRESTKDSPLTMSSIQTQVNAAADIILLFNNNNLVVPLIRGEVATTEEVLSLICDKIVNPSDFSNSLVDSMYEITILENEYTVLLDGLVESLYQSFEISGYQSNETAMTSNVLKGNLKTILSNAVTFLKYYENSTDLDFGDENTTRLALESLGRTINSAKSALLSDSSYDGLVGFLKTQINDFTAEFGDLSEVVDNLDKVVSWENELRSLAPLYGAVIDLNNDEAFSFEAVLDGTYSLGGFGDALNTTVNSNNSVFITNENIRDLFEVFLDRLISEGGEGLNKYLEMEIGNRGTLKNVMLNNIWNESLKTSNIENWGNELRYSLTLIVSINKTLSDLDLTRLSSPENNELKTLGKNIDDALAYTNLFISNDVLRVIFEDFIGEVETNISGLEDVLNIEYLINSQSYTVREGMLNNIFDSSTNSSNVSSWDSELEILKNILALDFGDDGLNRDDYASLGGILDDIKDSETLTRPIVGEVVVYYINKEVTSANLAEELIQGPVSNMTNIIRTHCASGLKQIVFEEEFNYLISLIDTLNATYVGNDEHSSDYYKLVAIGTEFNTITGLNGGGKSRIITKDSISDFISYYIDEMANSDKLVLDEEIKQIILEIKTNVDLNSITNYASEFSSLMSLVDLMNDDSTALNTIGSTIDTAKTDSIIVRSITKDVITFYIDKNVVDDPNDSSDDYLFEEGGVIEIIKSNVEELDVLNTSFTTEFGYLNEFKDFIGKKIELGEGSKIAEVFDRMAGTVSPSHIITRKPVINMIMSHTFSEEVAVSMGESSDYKGVINDITANLADYSGTYIKLFTDLDTLDGYVSDLVGITSTDQFIEQANASPNIGEKLDNIRNMTCCGGLTAWKIADILFDKIMSFDNIRGTTIETAINSYLLSDETNGGVNFDSYETTGNTGVGYYSGIVTHIVSLLTNNKN